MKFGKITAERDRECVLVRSIGRAALMRRCVFNALIEKKSSNSKAIKPLVIIELYEYGYFR